MHGALDPTGSLELTDLAALWRDPARAEGWTALLEAAAKSVHSLLISVPAPLEIVVSGRLARLPDLVARLGASLRDIAGHLLDPLPDDWRMSSERSDLRRLAGLLIHVRPILRVARQAASHGLVDVGGVALSCAHERRVNL